MTNICNVTAIAIEIYIVIYIYVLLLLLSLSLFLSLLTNIKTTSFQQLLQLKGLLRSQVELQENELRNVNSEDELTPQLHRTVTCFMAFMAFMAMGFIGRSLHL